jgi:deoxyhypusine synthase
MKKINQLKITKDMKVSELVSEMSGTGFGSGKVAEASRIMNAMFSDKDCKVFLGVAGALIPAGMREIMIDLLDSVDVFVCTGATLTHDLVEALGDSHYKIEMPFDDEKLNKEGLDRMYDVVMENKVYEKLERFFIEHVEELRKCKTISELLWKIGELTPGRSVLKTCYEKKIPVFCPALADSGIGLMIWGRIMEGKEFETKAFDDMKDIIDIAWTAEKAGVIYLGGGVPKNFIQQALQFSKGANYGIQITTDREVFGGSSGAPLKEGMSWGKLKYDADFVDVICDVTIALPLIYGSVK